MYEEADGGGGDNRKTYDRDCDQLLVETRFVCDLPALFLSFDSLNLKPQERSKQYEEKDFILNEK